MKKNREALRALRHAMSRAWLRVGRDVDSAVWRDTAPSTSVRAEVHKAVYRAVDRAAIRPVHLSTEKNVGTR